MMMLFIWSTEYSDEYFYKSNNHRLISINHKEVLQEKQTLFMRNQIQILEFVMKKNVF